MQQRREDDEYAKTEILDSDAIPDQDPAATAVLGEKYRREIEAEASAQPTTMSKTPPIPKSQP